MELVKQKSGGPRKTYTGFVSLKVVACNPTVEESATIRGYEPEEGKEAYKYQKADRDGNDQVVISFLCEAQTAEKQKFDIPFYITNKEMVWSNSKKPQWVNQTGNNATCDSEENLKDWFTNFQEFDTKANIAPKKYRKALEGEAKFYGFIKPWLSKVKFGDPATNILLNTDKLFNNVEKYVETDIRPLIKAEPEDSMVGEVIALAYVESKDQEDGSIKYIQKFWPEFLGPTTKVGSRWVSTMNEINLAIKTGDWKVFKSWYEQLTGEHGCKHAYKLQPLAVFNPDDHMQATNQVLKQDTTDINNDPDPTGGW